MENLSESCMNVWMQCQDLVLDFVFFFFLVVLSKSFCGMMYEWLNELLECCGESVWICLNAVSGFVFDFGFFPSRWSCLNISVESLMYECLNELLECCGRICLNNVWMSECSVRICFWISFFFLLGGLV